MGFSAPMFLWGLLAVAIPVVVHLFHFRRYRKVYFSNVEQLASLQTESRRRSQLRQWLVLVARVLAIVGIVLAFARPVVGGEGATEVAGSEAAVSVYIDNTYSMEAATAGGSRLDEAQRKVREIVAAYPIGTRFQLLTSDLAAGQMAWLNRDEVLAMLDEVQPTAASPLMSKAMACQHEYLRQHKGGARHCYVVSDFQRSGSDLVALPTDSTVSATLVAVGGAVEENVYVDTVAFDAPTYVAGGVVGLTATLRNDGRNDVEQVPVKLVVGGEERAVAAVDIAAGSAAKVELRFAVGAEVWADGWVEVADYPVVFDNRYYFSLHICNKVRVLEWEGAQAGDEFARLFGRDSVVELDRQRRGEMHSLANYDMVILNEVATMTSGEVQQVAAWVQEGGCVVVVPVAGSEKEAAESVNSLLVMLGMPTLGHWVERETRAEGVDMSNGLYRGVFNGKSEEMEMPMVRGHYAVEGQAIYQPIITLADRGKLIVEARAGQGRVYLFTTPLSGGWTDFAGQALFVPTVYNMALYGRSRMAVSHTIGEETVIDLEGDYAGRRQPPMLTDGEDFSFIPDVRKVGGHQQMLLHGEIGHDGLYRLAEEHIAFNYSRRESQMDFYERDEVAKAVKGKEGYRVASHPERVLTDEIATRTQGRQLWRWCLVLALLALAAETLMLKQKKG